MAVGEAVKHTSHDGKNKWKHVGNLEFDPDNWNDGERVDSVHQQSDAGVYEYMQVLTLLLTSKQRRSVTSSWLTSGSVSLMKLAIRRRSRV